MNNAILTGSITLLLLALYGALPWQASLACAALASAFLGPVPLAAIALVFFLSAPLALTIVPLLLAALLALALSLVTRRMVSYA